MVDLLIIGGMIGLAVISAVFLILALNSAAPSSPMSSPNMSPTSFPTLAPSLWPVTNTAGHILRSKLNKKCADIDKEKRNLMQWECSWATNQQYLWEEVKVGVYRIRSSHNPTWCLQVKNNSTDAAATVVAGECNDEDHQLWRATTWAKGFLRSHEKQYYQITALHTEQCLNIYGGSEYNGADLIQFPCQGGDNELWIFD